LAKITRKNLVKIKKNHPFVQIFLKLECKNKAEATEKHHRLFRNRKTNNTLCHKSASYPAFFCFQSLKDRKLEERRKIVINTKNTK